MASARILLNLKMKFSNFEAETIILPLSTDTEMEHGITKTKTRIWTSYITHTIFNMLLHSLMAKLSRLLSNTSSLDAGSLYRKYYLPPLLPKGHKKISYFLNVHDCVKTLQTKLQFRPARSQS